MKYCLRIHVVLILSVISYTTMGMSNMFDINYWRCRLKRTNTCPDNDVKFYLYTHDTGNLKKRIDTRNKHALDYAGFDPNKKNAIIIHGFNGTHASPPLKLLRDAYLTRKDYNVFMVEYHTLVRFPCYLSALSNTKIVAQCTAYLYAYIMDMGGIARDTVCVGHSLGAHICGMVSNHLDIKQHKIVGLDPARPLVDQYASKSFRLTRDDAHQVQIIHTNAGLLGEPNQVGHVDFCVNGGMWQPGCKGHLIRRARCSHFQSVCYYAASVKHGGALVGQPCATSCPKRGSWGIHTGRSIPLGEETPETARGQYCVRIDHDKDCPFN